jgi:hypothetical protein
VLARRLPPFAGVGVGNDAELRVVDRRGHR